MNEQGSKILSYRYAHPGEQLNGLREGQVKLENLVAIAWNVAYTALWNGVVFSDEEESRALEIIRNLLIRDADPVEAYCEFTQRIMLGRYRYVRYPVLNMPLPEQWLEEGYKFGYMRTKPWYNSIVQQRKANKTYKEEMGLFPYAVLAVVKVSLGKNFHDWRNFFIERNRSRMCSLFLSTVNNVLID